MGTQISIVTDTAPHTAFVSVRVRVDIIGHLKSRVTEIYLYIDARTADYIHTHP